MNAVYIPLSWGPVWRGVSVVWPMRWGLSALARKGKPAITTPTTRRLTAPCRGCVSTLFLFLSNLFVFAARTESMSKAEKLLRELIALPSVNPAFLPAKDPRAGEQRVADFLAATAAKAGLEVEFQPVFPKRANLLARFSPKGKVRRRVLLAPHLDTVNAPEAQFTPREKNGRLFGRGACDTKGSAAAMMCSLCELARSHQRPAETEIVFTGLVDEENGQGGS